MFDNLITSTLFILLLGLLFIINTILGVLIGTKEDGFNLKKLLYGFLKGGIAILCTISFCFVIEITPIILNRIDINMSEEIITFIELMTIITTAYKKYVLDILDKLKKIFNI